MRAVMGDFTVPTTIHKMTWDYPLMPEKVSIPEDQLSPKQVELNENNRAKHSLHQQYLLQTMWDKHHYFVYGEPCHRNSQPYNGFRWMSQTELLELKASPKEFFERLRKRGKMCGVMGDFTVPTANHKKTWDYPLMPEKASIHKKKTNCHQNR